MERSASYLSRTAFQPWQSMRKKCSLRERLKNIFCFLLYQSYSRLNNWKCERFCVDIPTQDNSVVSMAGDVILSAKCRRAVDVRTGEVLWDVVDHPGSLLLSSCTDLEAENDIIRGRDCINGTAMPSAMFEDLTNFTTLMNVFQSSGHKYKLDQSATTPVVI